MKRLTILLLFVCSITGAQDLSYYVKSQGHWVKYDGKYLRYTYEERDAPIEVDSIDVYLNYDFTSWSEMDGIYQSEFYTHWGNYAYIQSEPTSYAPNLGIEAIDGNNAMRNDYPAGQCCHGLCATANGGTGGHVDTPLDTVDMSEGYLSFNIFIPTGFVQPEDLKLLGVLTGDYRYETTHSLMRVILQDRTIYDANGTNTDIAFYVYDFTADPENATGPSVRGANIQVGRGAWHNITLRFYCGNINQSDGLVEAFYDGLYSGNTFYYQFRSAGVTGGDNVVETFTYQTFAGGCDTQYFIDDEEFFIDDICIFNYADGVTVPRGSQRSTTGRRLNFPTESNWPR